MTAVGVLLFALLALFCLPAPALGDSQSLTEAAEKVDQANAEMAEAKAEKKRIDEDIARLEEAVSEKEAEIPGLEERAESAAVALYKQDGDFWRLLEAVLGQSTFTDALRCYDSYMDMVDYRMDEVSAAKAAKDGLLEDKSRLKSDRKAARKAVSRAKRALEDAIAARDAAKKAAEKEERASRTGSSLAADIDWSLSEEEFVSSWGKKIDSYLSGTVLSGYGEVFAEAAYENGADPRWSPAISRIESGCGAKCFRPHNAWGWMGHSFDDWETAIRAHVKYIAGPLYGGYITPRGAATYCPPGGPWYSAVSAEMRKIG